MYNFIIPYRNREEHKNFFIEKYSELSKEKDCQFYFVHQCDDRLFNRGAMLNIGFLEFCKTRPEGLFIFHDVDITPITWESYRLEPTNKKIRKVIGWEDNGEIRSLGGICSFYKDEFETVNGYPNYWGWGYEDIALYERTKLKNLEIDYDSFINVNNQSYLKTFTHSYPSQHTNEINRQQFLSEKITDNGLSSIKYNILSVEIINENMKQLNVEIINV